MWNDPKPHNWKPVLEPMLGRWVNLQLRTPGDCLFSILGRLQLHGEFVELQAHGLTHVIALADVFYVTLPGPAQQEKLTIDAMHQASEAKAGIDPATEGR